MSIIDRLLGLASKITHWAIELYGVLINKRRWFAVLMASLRRFWEQKIYYYSGYFTYNAFLALLAVLMVVFATLGFISPNSSTAQESILRTFNTLRPILGDNPQEVLAQMERYRQVIGILGILALLWTGSKLFRALEWGSSEIMGIKRRSYFKGKIVGTMFISIIGSIFILAIVFNLILSVVWSAIAGEQGVLHDIGIYALAPIITLALGILFFIFMYKLVPTVKQRFRFVLIGAVVSGCLFFLVQSGLNLYFGVISDVPTIYGSLSVAIVLILFVHLVGMISFFGMELIYVMGNEDLTEKVLSEHEELQAKMLAKEEEIARKIQARFDRTSSPNKES